MTQIACERWAALGSTALLCVTEPTALSVAHAQVRQELEKIDRACSRFREDSDLSRANAAAGRAVQVSELLVQAIELGLAAARLTEGTVDPTLGAAMQLAGYDRDWQELTPPHGEPPARAITIRAVPAWQTLELDPEHNTVRVPPGAALDLGATAKAWAADRAAERAARATSCGVLVCLGGDVATAGPPPRDGWSIHVTDDHRSSPDAPGQTVVIHSGGLATSSMTVRRWSHARHTAHHLIDPTTGVPASGPWRTVSVAAADCAQANIAATAAILRGDSALSWLEHRDLPARLQAWDGNVRTVAGWPAEPAPAQAA
jgi:FAD:protein FMN transferase